MIKMTYQDERTKKTHDDYNPKNGPLTSPGVKSVIIREIIYIRDALEAGDRNPDLLEPNKKNKFSSKSKLNKIEVFWADCCSTSLPKEKC